MGGNQFRVGRNNFNLGFGNYRPAYANYPFYRGYWNGNYGQGWGNQGWYGNSWGYGGGFGGQRYYRPLGWGLGAWGLGGIGYNSGYLGYSNPYYVQSTGFNYSQPIALAYAEQPATVSEENGLNAAIVAFQENDYDRALDIVNHGIAESPNDAVMHEFRALVLFAKGDYQQSTATLHAVLAVGPGWNWTTMSNLYSGVEVYTTHLRTLEAFARNHPQDSAAQFLLGYHYLTGGYDDAAARQLRLVSKITPGDRVATDLLRMITPAETQQSNLVVPSRESTSPAASPAIDPAILVGNWSAAREDGSKFALTLSRDSTFTWEFTPKGQQSKELKGKYSVDGDVLALEGTEGGALIANVKTGTRDDFNFKLLGAPGEDPGLNFSR